ncbi:MAG: hypothetical protein KDD48_01710 [Bdellovibrionales bacterium]|nr:hypothetical protein [Bdellovibrionales bacterium]
MFSSLVGTINIKRLILAVIGVFVYIVISDYLIHGLAMKNLYQETIFLWRSETDMQAYMPWMFLGQFIIAKFFCILFARGYEGRGAMEGLRFSLLIGPLMVAPNFIQYAVMPLTPSILASWLAFGMLQVVGAGIVASLIYRK